MQEVQNASSASVMYYEIFSQNFTMVILFTATSDFRISFLNFCSKNNFIDLLMKN